MALPPLDYFLSPVPAYGLVTPLSAIAQALGQPGGLGRSTAVNPSHVVVVDDEHRPLGAIALGQLWALSHALNGPIGEKNGGENGGESGAEQRLFGCQPWLEPVVEVYANQIVDAAALARLGTLTQGTPPPTLVVVDHDGQYLGVLNPVRVLGWLARSARTEAGAASPTGLGEAQALPAAGQRAWVLELSHALKTPMTTLLGLSTLLLDSRIGSLTERQFRYVSLMQQAIRKLTSLVNLLLDWMRLEAGQIGLSQERVYLQPLTDELLPSFFSAQPGLRATATWAETFAVCLATAEGWVQADPLRLRQSLHYGLGYLVSRGAMPAGLIVEPWGPWLSLTLWSSTAMVNPGPPLVATMAALRSQPQPESLEGLGLTLARRFSQLQGGELSGLSTPVWGSRITLLLPAPPTSASADKTVLVLLASASETVIEQVYGSLRGSPYRLAVAPCCQTMAAMQSRLAPPCTLIHWEALADAPADAAARLALVQRLDMPGPVLLKSARNEPAPGPDPRIAPDLPLETPGVTVLKTLFTETLAHGLRPTLDQICLTTPASLPSLKGMTMLLLRPPEAPGALPSLVQAWLQRYHCRLLQVDDLPQANLLSRVWQPQAVILDGAMPVSMAYLQALARQPDLARLPLVTLGLSPYQEAGLALGLALVPCPEVLTQSPPQAVVSLMQAIAQARPVAES